MHVLQIFVLNLEELVANGEAAIFVCHAPQRDGAHVDPGPPILRLLHYREPQAIWSLERDIIVILNFNFL